MAASTPDESIETAALREASEEVGVAPASVRLLGRLTPLQIPISGYMLHPVVGLVESRPVFRRAEWEVARILEVPLTLLRDPEMVKRRSRTREIGGETVSWTCRTSTSTVNKCGAPRRWSSPSSLPWLSAADER